MVRLILNSLLYPADLPSDAAGATSVFAQTCSGSCYYDYVVGNGSAYDNAYFDVASVRVYSVSGSNTVVLGSSALAFRPNFWVWAAAALGSGLMLFAL